MIGDDEAVPFDPGLAGGWGGGPKRESEWPIACICYGRILPYVLAETTISLSSSLSLR